MNSKMAFTLAETLLTLGIIGIIAAMTIPALKKYAGEQEMLTGLKKAYSTLSNVVSRSEIDNGSVRRWNFNQSAEDFVKEYIIPYMNVARECGLGRSSCFGEEYKLPNGTEWSDSTTYRFILADGSRVVFLYQKPEKQAHFYIDINGEKKPNTRGMDVFVFTLTAKAFEDYGHKVDAPGVYPFGAGLTRTKMMELCKESGLACSSLIISDGYRLKSDYPW